MGVINLRVRDLDHARQTVWLRETIGAEREQPISRSLLQAVADLAAARGSTLPDDHAMVTLRREAGTLVPVTRPDLRPYLREGPSRIRVAERTPLAAHVLRHTAITADSTRRWVCGRGKICRPHARLCDWDLYEGR